MYRKFKIKNIIIDNLLRLFVVAAILTIGLVISCSTGSGIRSDKSQDKGYNIALRLEPGPNNPRNSEGDFIELKDGRILFIYSRYTGTSGSDHAPAFLAGRYSSDGGKTWTSEDVKIIEQEGQMNVMSVSLLRLQNGEIALFYLKKNSTEDCIPLIRISNDEARTWSDPVPCIPDREGYFVLNNDRVIQLENGRLLLSVARHNGPGEEWVSNAPIWSYYSDDNGRTWKASAMVPNPDNVVTQEPGVVELNNGNIMMFIRTDAGVQYFSYSTDKGETWSPAEAGNLESPLSPASIERIPSTGDLLAVWNNNGVDRRRTPLTTAISKDEGKTWENIKNVEDDPDGWYCYTAIHFTDNDILLGHCAGNRPAGTGLAVTQITKLSLDWIYN